MSSFQERREARIARLRARAAGLTAKGASAFAKASEMASCIPMGQPIVSNSYRQRDINFRNKIDNAMRRGCETLKEAEEAARKAESAECNTAISSDDPDAVEKLKAELGSMIALRERMKNINKAWRKDGVAGLAACGMTEEQVAQVVAQIEKAYRLDKQPFSKSKITNLGANIRRVEGRVEQLERRQKAAETLGDTSEKIGEIEIVIARTENRLRIIFPGKPDALVREELKRNGFRWSPTANAWQRMPNARALQEARAIAAKAQS